MQNITEQEEFSRIINRISHIAESVGESQRETDALMMYNLSVLEELRTLRDQPITTIYDVSNIPTQCILKIHVVDNMECAICLESFRLRQKVFKLKCNHMFHRDCGKNWLKLHGTCPTCRGQI